MLPKKLNRARQLDRLYRLAHRIESVQHVVDDPERWLEQAKDKVGLAIRKLETGESRGMN